VKKSKTKKASRLFEGKIDAAIASAKKSVQSAQELVQRSRMMIEITRDTVEESKRKRKERA
jgi:predicted solute-binding protein